MAAFGPGLVRKGMTMEKEDCHGRAAWSRRAPAADRPYLSDSMAGPSEAKPNNS
jgi:hypothetical protein